MKYYVTYLDNDNKPSISHHIYTSKREAEVHAAAFPSSRDSAVLQEALKDELTCEDFEYLANIVDELRGSILFGMDEAGSSPAAELHFLKALNDLQSAEFNLKLAALDQAFNTRR